MFADGESSLELHSVEILVDVLSIDFSIVGEVQGTGLRGFHCLLAAGDWTHLQQADVLTNRLCEILTLFGAIA